MKFFFKLGCGIYILHKSLQDTPCCIFYKTKDLFYPTAPSFFYERFTIRCPDCSYILFPILSHIWNRRITKLFGFWNKVKKKRNIHFISFSKISLYFRKHKVFTTGNKAVNLWGMIFHIVRRIRRLRNFNLNELFLVNTVKDWKGHET